MYVGLTVSGVWIEGVGAVVKSMKREQRLLKNSGRTDEAT